MRFAPLFSLCCLPECILLVYGTQRNQHVEMSFGFDTATKVYSELTGNLGLDAISAKKTFHFVRLMGRSASHITLEVALQTHPNLTLIGEEVEAKKQTLAQCVNAMVELIMERGKLGKNYGLIILVCWWGRWVGVQGACGWCGRVVCER